MRAGSRGIVFVAVVLASLLVGGPAPQLDAAPLAGTDSGEAAPNWRKRLTDAARPLGAGVRLRLVVTESKVSAATRDQAVAELAAKHRETPTPQEGGRGPMGLLWLLSWKLETEAHLGSCQMENANITVEFTADFPILDGPLAADAAAQEAWTAEMEALFEQRVKTLKVLRDAAREIYQEVSRMRGGSCGDMNARANEVARIKALEANEAAAQTLGGAN
jgi:hypothetical protein